MLRFILWSLLFYGIYRLIWPRQGAVSSTGRGQGVPGHSANPSANGTANNKTSDDRGANASAGPGRKPGQPYTRAAVEVGEYIDYEELR